MTPGRKVANMSGDVQAVMAGMVVAAERVETRGQLLTRDQVERNLCARHPHLPPDLVRFIVGVFLEARAAERAEEGPRQTYHVQTEDFRRLSVEGYR